MSFHTILPSFLAILSLSFFQSHQPLVITASIDLIPRVILEVNSKPLRRPRVRDEQSNEKERRGSGPSERRGRPKPCTIEP